MPHIRRLSYCLVAVAAAIAGCGPRALQPAEPADAFLDQCLTRYQGLTNFKAACEWHATAGGSTFEAKRSLEYDSPNRYRVQSIHDNSLLLTSVSDGGQVTEYSNVPGMVAGIYVAPDHVAQADSPQMRNPLDCGSPLYAFFNGPNGTANLVDPAGGPVRYGSTEVIDGQPCADVLFTEVGGWGPVDVAIGTQDQLVYRISYDAAALVAKGLTTEVESAPSSGAPPFKASLPPHPTSMPVSETFHDMSLTVAIADADFDTRLPDNIPPFTVAEGATGTGGGAGESTTDMDKPPVPIGSPAPDFAVVDARTGAVVRLSSLRGKIVLIDFWATWCPPCRHSLPETQHISSQYAGPNLAVMAVSGESRSTITGFVNNHGYTFPAYEDRDQSASQAYNANAIPTISIIDRQGRLAFYAVGLQDPSTVEAALKNAGVTAIR
jgi:peroxiredoxin